MEKYGLLALLQAKPGKEQEVETFLESAEPLAQRETGTVAWYAVKLGPGAMASSILLKMKRAAMPT